jgi:hypothetical protein
VCYILCYVLNANDSPIEVPIDDIVVHIGSGI